MQIETTHHAPAGWEDYVSGHPLATAYHRARAVRIGADAFGLKTYFLTARAAGAIVGVLPLVEQSSLLFGRYLVSVPFLTYGGVLVEGDEAALALARQAGRLAIARKADHVELRHSTPVTGLDLPERLDKVSMILDLPASEAQLSKQLGSKLRAQIKRGDRENPEVVWGGRELLGEFYAVFAAGMHELGTPVYSRRFFDVVCASLPGLLEVIVVRAAGRVQAAAILVRHGSRIEVPWAAATPYAKRVSLNMRMYWEMLTRSIESGASAFDFGRSTVDSGTYKFKAQWGAVPRQLHWHYWLPAGAPLPKLNHSNPKYARAAELWRRMPLACANLVGPWISRHLP